MIAPTNPARKTRIAMTSTNRGHHRVRSRMDETLHLFLPRRNCDSISIVSGYMSNLGSLQLKTENQPFVLIKRAMMILLRWRMDYRRRQKCPDWENARPAAVVNIEHPPFITLGFILTTLVSCFILSFPKPKSAAGNATGIKGIQKRKN